MDQTPDDKRRIQIALPENAAYLELLLPQQNIRVTRTVPELPRHLQGADIADAPTDTFPSTPVRYSIYNDPSGFMELETVGGCDFPLLPGTVLSLDTITTLHDIAI